MSFITPTQFLPAPEPSKYNLWGFVLAFATMLGAFGGFPQPPKAFLWLTSWKIVQWFLVFVLLYQGGTGQDPVFALIVTAITFVVYLFLKALELAFDSESQSE